MKYEICPEANYHTHANNQSAMSPVYRISSKAKEDH